MVPILIFISTLSLIGLWPAIGFPDTDRERLAAYLDRLASVSPRDADAHAELAKWCLEQGLAAEATHAYKRAIAVDGDCAVARAALGYVRYGTGWRLQGAGGQKASKRPAGETNVTTSGDLPEASTGLSGTPSRKPGVGTEGQLEAAAEPLGAPNRVERKKNWAAEASVKFGISFVTHEDRDFLVHSTFSRKDREFRRLLDYLRRLRKIVSDVLGVRSRTVIWPDKLQIVLLRSEPEYDRFALNIDNVQSARNPQGAYTRGDHTVLWKPDSEGVSRVVGSTALGQLYDSDRPVGWWLEDGVAEIVVAASPWGTSRKHREQAFVEAARILGEEVESALVFKLLETRKNRDTRSSKNAALAMTLTQFLMKRSRRGFTAFVKELKSDAAPPPPAAREDLDSYLLNYISFQEKALKTHFGTSVPLLGEKWTEYVIETGKKMEKDLEESERRVETRRSRRP